MAAILFRHQCGNVAMHLHPTVDIMLSIDTFENKIPDILKCIPLNENCCVSIHYSQFHKVLFLYQVIAPEHQQQS